MEREVLILVAVVVVLDLDTLWRLAWGW
jgi:hypothetical protein